MELFILPFADTEVEAGKFRGPGSAQSKFQLSTVNIQLEIWLFQRDGQGKWWCLLDKVRTYFDENPAV
jgi:hypothetical protein